MKLHLESNKARIRLSPEEINRLKSEQSISEQLAISPGNQFSFTVKMPENIDQWHVNFNSNTLEILIPATIAEKWIKSSQIGIKETIVTKQGDNISVIVEEDLPPRKNKQKK